MTAPEDRRDEERFERTLDAEEGSVSQRSAAEAEVEPRAELVPDADPDEDLAAGPEDGR